MDKQHIADKISKLVNEIAGFVYKPEHEFAMNLEDEKIAIMAACGGMAIAVGRKCDESTRQYAQKLALQVADQVQPARSGSAHVAPPGHHQVKI